MATTTITDASATTGICVTNLFNIITENNINLIYSMPTSYDVEKVVAEIRRRSGNGYRDVDGDYVPPLIKTANAIDIVERGGVDD